MPLPKACGPGEALPDMAMDFAAGKMNDRCHAKALLSSLLPKISRTLRSGTRCR